MRKQLVTAMMVVFACIVLVGCSDLAELPAGTVSGKVVDSSGAPVSGVKVQLLNKGFQPYTSAAAAAKFGGYSSMNAANLVACVATATTDTNGAYVFSGIPYGTYAVLPTKTDPSQSFISTAGEYPATATVSAAESVANFKQDTGGLSNPVFFVHISDTHFDAQTSTHTGISDKGVDLTKSGKALMSALFAQVIPVIKPHATIHTGDMVEKGYIDEAWPPYTKLLNDSLLSSSTPYVDIIGNHDVKVLNSQFDYEAGLQNFLLYAWTPTRYGYTTLDSPIGKVRLIRTNTAASTHSNYAKRNWENIYGYFPESQQQNLYNHPDRTQPVALNVVLGHSPVAENYISPPAGYIPGTNLNDNKYADQITNGNERMKQLIEEFQAPVYLSGHVHIPGVRWVNNKSLVVTAATFGFYGPKSTFYLVAYDVDAKSPAAKLVEIDATNPSSPGVNWPIVFITTPANSSLGNSDSYTAGNPNAQPFTTNEIIMLKTMVFSPETVTSVKYRIDEGAVSSPLANVRNSNGRVWATGIPLAGLSKGSHTVTVTATRSNGTTGTDTISITVQ